MATGACCSIPESFIPSRSATPQGASVAGASAETIGSGPEVALLREAARPFGRRPVRLACADAVSRSSPAGGRGRRGSGGRRRSARRWRALRAGRAPRAFAGHGHRDGVVERDHGVVGDLHQQLVQRHDLWPVGRLGVGASSWIAAIAACSWYGPVGPARESVGDEGHALGDVRRRSTGFDPARPSGSTRRRARCAPAGGRR